MKINFKYLSVLLIMVIFGLTLKITILQGYVSGIEDKSVMLLEVACKYPAELSSSIDAMSEKIYKDYPISGSYEKFRAGYKWPCK